MESLTRSARGRKTKQKEARTENINLRCTLTELENLKTVVEIRKKKGLVTSQSDILFGGIKSYDIAEKLLKLRNTLAVDYTETLKYANGFLGPEQADQYNYHRGRADASMKMVNQIDDLLSL